ncbi:MAG: DUF5689 domain-containing protein [Bacteroidales bacterium]|nr:DUF5689 domain-containing protein [Bacteroidales bacterium]
MKKITYILLAVLCLPIGISCSGPLFDDAQKIPLVSLGTKQKIYEIPASGAGGELEIISNGEFVLDGARECNWLAFDKVSGEGNCKVQYSASPNDGFRRKAVVLLKSTLSSRTDTLEFRQQASIEAVLSVGSTSLISTGAGGAQMFPLETNIPFGDIKVDLRYVTNLEDNWVEDISFSDGTPSKSICIKTLKNSTDAPRIAQVVMSFTDGWNEKVEVAFNLIQKNKDEIFGTPVTFEELRSNYADGNIISDYITLEGIIVSDRTSGNAGENEQITATTVDYTGAKVTSYLESPDGKYGVKIIAASEEDNVFDKYDKVQILLKGCVVSRIENPQRYEISGVTSDMVVERENAGKAAVPVKEKHIADLVDDDIYTYVTLKDVEIPVRKGPVAPINEGYSIGTNANRIDKYPRLIRDINGDVSYLLTNTVCKYRNDGTVLPYGSGNLSGVVVHERFVRFEFRNGANILDIDNDPDLGYISRYQIRHQCKEDIWGNMNPSVEDSFSALLTEYRFVNPDPDAAQTRSALPTYGTNGRLTHTYQEKYTRDTLLQRIYQNDMTINFVYTFSYLGPIGNNAQYMFGLHKGNDNGMGIILDPEKEHWPQWASWQNLLSLSPDGTLEWCGPHATSEDARNINLFNGSDQPGKAICPWGTRTGFSNQYWWNYETGRPYGWLLEFSTKGISTSHISLQFTALNYSRYTPRFWKVEWSNQDSQDPEHDADWHLVAPYTVPDVTEWAVATVFSLCGYKQYNIDLPLEILGKDKVYLRLVPASDVASSGSDYADTHMCNDVKIEHESAIDYLAIRYNK